MPIRTTLAGSPSSLEERVAYLEKAIKQHLGPQFGASTAQNPHPNLLLSKNIDDTPVNGELDEPISSNWAYDHVNTADQHPEYLKESDFDDVDFLVGTATGHTGAEIVVGTSPGGELGGTWASPTVDATHSGSSHAGVIATHEGLADPHTGYRLESADHSHQSTGAQAGTLDHGLALTGLTDDDHTQYQLKSLLTTQGDTPYASAASTWARLAIGAVATILRSNGSVPGWQAVNAWNDILRLTGVDNLGSGAAALELGFASPAALVQGYKRSDSTYQPMRISASKITCETSAGVREHIGTSISLTDNTATTIGTVVVPVGSFVTLQVYLGTLATDGTDYLGYGSAYAITIINKTGTAEASTPLLIGGAIASKTKATGAAALTSEACSTSISTTTVTIRITSDITGFGGAITSFTTTPTWFIQSGKVDYTFTPA